MYPYRELHAFTFRDEPSASDHYSEEVTDESLEWSPKAKRRGKGGRMTSSTRRSSRRRRVLARMDDFVVDEYDSDEEKRSYRQPKHRTRGASRKQRSYFSETESEASGYTSEEMTDSDSSPRHKRRSSKHKKSSSKSSHRKHHKKSNKKKKRKIELSDNSATFSDNTDDCGRKKRKSRAKYEQDSDWAASDDNGVKGRRRAAAKRISYKEPKWSESDDEKTPKKKKGKMDVSNFVRNSDGDNSATDENSGSRRSTEIVDRAAAIGDEPIGSASDHDDDGNTPAVTLKKQRRRIQEASDSSDTEELDKEGVSPLKSVKTSDTSGEVSPVKKPELSSLNDSFEKINNEPVTYTFKAKVNGTHDHSTVTSDVGVDDANQTATIDNDNLDEESDDREVDVDDLSDIGDIVDYITNEWPVNKNVLI